MGQVDAGRAPQELLVAKEGDKAGSAATERVGRSHWEGRSEQAGRGDLSSAKKNILHPNRSIRAACALRKAVLSCPDLAEAGPRVASNVFSPRRLCALINSLRY